MAQNYVVRRKSLNVLLMIVVSSVAVTLSFSFLPLPRPHPHTQGGVWGVSEDGELAGCTMLSLFVCIIIINSQRV